MHQKKQPNTYLKVLIRYFLRRLTGLSFNLANKKRTNQSDCKTRLETLFVKHSRLSLLDAGTENALKSLFMSGLWTKIRSLIKGHKQGWEATPLAELIALAEHVEKTLEQDKIQKPINIWLCSYSSSKSWEDLQVHFSTQNIEVLQSGILHPEMSAFTVNNQGTGKKERPLLNGTLRDFHLLIQTVCPWGEVLKNLITEIIRSIDGTQGSSGKLLPMVSLKEQREPMIKNNRGTSLVAQWLRIRLPMQGTWGQALVREYPTRRGATKPMRHNY